MSGPKKILYLVFLIAAGVYFVSRPSEESLIKKRLSDLAKTISVRPEADTLTRAGKAKRLSEFFVDPISVRLEFVKKPVQEWVNKTQLQEAAMLGLTHVRELSVEFHDVTTKVAPDKKSAESHLTATAMTDSQTDREAMELELGWVKPAGSWEIQSVRTVRSLQ